MSSRFNHTKRNEAKTDDVPVKWTGTHRVDYQSIDTNPAMVEFKRLLYMIYKAEDGTNDIWVTRSADGNSFGNPYRMQVHQTTTAAPAAAVFHDTLYVVYKANEGTRIFVTYTQDGDNWVCSPIDGAFTTDKPALAVFKDTLYVVHKNGDSQSEQLQVTTSVDGVRWQTKDLPDFFTSSSGPALAAAPFKDGQLYVVFKGTNAKQNVNDLLVGSTTDGSTWQQQGNFTGYKSSHTPAIAFFNDSLYVVYKHFESTQLVLTRSPDGETWYNAQYVENQFTSVGPGLVGFKSNIFLGYKSKDNNGLWITHSQGVIKYFTGIEIENLLKKLDTDIEVKRYLIGTTLYRSLNHGTVVDVWYQSGLNDSNTYPLKPPTFSRIDFTTIVKGSASKFIKFNQEGAEAAGAFGILWVKTNIGVIDAYNFYISPLGLVKLFDPVSGRDYALPADSKPQFATF